MEIEDAEIIIKCNIDYYTGTGDYDGYVGFDHEDVEAFNMAIDTMHKYQQLKADMVAILDELKKGMDSIKECEYQIYGKEHWNFVGKCQDIIQQKINTLKKEKISRKED